MKLELIGHDEKYAVEQSLLTLFPAERPVYGRVTDEDARWAKLTMLEDCTAVRVTTELGVDGQSIERSYSFPLAGSDYEREGQRRHAIGMSFFRAARDLLHLSPAWGSLTGVRPSKVAVHHLKNGDERAAFDALTRLYDVTPARARLAIEAAVTGLRVQSELKPNDISLYVGIPFCPTRCAYCSFVSQSVEKSFALVKPYLDALCDEIESAGKMVREQGLSIKSFYMGGGTPTTLSAPQMDRLLTALEKSFDFSSNKVEALPAWPDGCALQTINGSYNAISNIDGLRNMESLSYIYMEYNLITDIDALADCVCLVQLNVFGNEIKDASKLRDRGIIVNYDPT